MSQPPPETQYGQAAAGLGFVSEAQVRECLDIQAKMREMGIDEMLGDILVKKRYLTPAQHQAVLKKLGVVTQPIPGYTLHGRIGQGGMGTVYKATQTSVNRLVAIKVLAPQFTKDKMFVARFFQEARAAGKLSHQNLIAAIDVGEASGLYYFVMEFIVGRSCREILNKEGPFPEPRALAVALQMAAALEYIHQHRLVHRDIKPENILLAEDGTVKLCDLGLAKSTSAAEQSLTQTGLAVGTPFFMSPEQCRGDRDVDIRADLYGLGASLYFLATGEHPYEGKSALETMNLQISAPVPDPRRAAPKLGNDFTHVIQKLMAKDRNDRYPSPTELLEDLRNVQSGTAPVHARPPAPRPTARVPSTARIQIARPKPRWPWIAGVAAAAALAAGLAMMMAPSGEPARPGPVAARTPERPPDPADPAPKVQPPRESVPAALLRAREASVKDPGNLAALVPLYEKAVEETRGTPLFDETRRVLEGLYRRELEPVEAQAAGAAKREEFGAALALLEQARLRHAAESWTQAVDARITGLRSETGRVYDWVRSAAVEARRRGSEDEVRTLTERIAKWGLAEMQKGLERDLAAVAAPARPVTPPVDGYAKRWETAVAMAAARDTAAAVAAIEGSTHPDTAADLEILRTAGAVLAEALQALSKLPRGTKLSIRYADESGALQKIEEAVWRADPFRIEFRRDEGALLVTLGEIAADSLAEGWKTRSPRKASKDGRAAALLCILDGDVEAARRHLGADPDLPAKYWEFGRRLEEGRSTPRPKEEEARRRYYAAEREFADPATTADAVRGYESLLKDSAGTSFVRRNRAAIASRKEGGREFFYFVDDLKAAGTFRMATPPKGPACWTSEADSEPAKRAENSVEVTFSVLPDTEYRAWAYVGGCCMETLGFQLQAADAADPSGAAPQPAKHSLSVTKTHASHGGAKQPVRWGWVALALPKYTSAGTRRVRLLTDQKGFSVAYAFVSSVKTAPPRDAELKEIEKARGEPARAVAVEPGLVGWWKLDERSGVTAADSTKNKNHGTLKNGPTWIAGKAGGALSFNGTDSHVKIPDSPSINSIGAQMSAACWVHRLADQPDYRLCVSRQLGTGDENQFWLGFEDNEMGFSITTSKGMLEITGKKAPNNEWIHLAGTYDGTTLRLYVNGVEATSSAQGGPLAASTRSLMIGGDEFDDKGSVQEVPKAIIDDVRLYNRALTAAEVAALARPR